MPLFPPPAISLPIYRAEDEPDIESFPLGGIWHEIATDISGNKYLKEIWIKEKLEAPKDLSDNVSDDFWISVTKYQFNFASSASISGNIAFRLPPDQNFDYFFQEANIFCLYSGGSGTLINSQNYWQVSANISFNPSFSFFGTGQLPNAIPGKSPMLRVISTEGKTQLVITFAKQGNPPNGQISASIDYRRIRK